MNASEFSKHLRNPIVLSIGQNDPTVAQGWISSPNSRGTVDIIWSCLLTILLACWTTVCVNVPPLRAGRLKQFERKLWVFMESLCGPEFIFHTALGQYVAAKRSIKDFEASGHRGWTLRHGFFADMGGFVLEPEDFVPFPLTVNQVHYLVHHGYVDFNSVCLSQFEINDKNKFDGMSRIIATGQLFWFVINVVARSAQNLAITTLEMTTIGFVFCSLCTFIVWRQKPQDVTEPIRLTPKATMAEILVQAGPMAAEPYSYTPMDFAARRRHWFGKIWSYLWHIPEHLGIHLHPRKRPIDKIWDDEFTEVGFFGSFVLAFVQFGFAGIHVAAWNFHFPTDAERLLWHVATLYIVASMVLTWLILSYAFDFRLRIREYWDPGLKGERQSLPGIHESDVPFSSKLTIPLGALYMFARASILLEDLVNLRQLPVSAYSSVNWNAFIPHFS